FERRVVSTRTAFDTTFDTVLRVGPLDLSTARGALELRAIGIPYPFIALCYVLSGSVPPVLARVARTVFVAPTQLTSGPADQGAFADETGSVTGAAKVCDGMTAAAYLFLTVGQIFSAKLDQTISDLENYEGLNEEEKADSAFALLAKARGILGVNPALAIT